MISEQWGFEDDIDPKKSIKQQIANLISNLDLFLEIIATLPSNEQSALENLIKENGKISASQFYRSYGSMREMGAVNREKERPDRNPISATENLFYKGLIGLSFFNEKKVVREYIYLPKEFFTFLRNQISNGHP